MSLAAGIPETTVSARPSGLGAASVTQLEMMPKAPDTRAANNPWPQWPRVCKTDYGQQEAIAVFGHDPRIYQTTVKEFVMNKKGELLKGSACQKLESKEGREDRKNDDGSESRAAKETVKADIVLIAAGFLGSQKYVTDAFKVDLDGRTNVATKARRHMQRAFRRCLYGRRYAPGTVSGGMGDPRGPGSCKRGG